MRNDEKWRGFKLNRCWGPGSLGIVGERGRGRPVGWLRRGEGEREKSKEEEESQSRWRIGGLRRGCRFPA